VHYKERGQGVPLVLVHGFPLDHRIFEQQIDALAAHARVIAPDLPGFGSSHGAGAFTIASLADDLHELLRSINALPCVLAGLSMGGYVALAFAKKYAPQLRGLVLIDTRAEGDSADGRAGRDKMIDLVRREGTSAVVDQMFPKMLAPQTATNDSQVAQQLRAIMNSVSPTTIELTLSAMRDREDYTSFLPSIAVPTLIIVGEHDAITAPPVAQSMQRAIRGSKLVTIAGAGHLSTMEVPREVSEAIANFIKTIQV
jgi:pimeloyl-ACP methyl ester carboxylesterase